MAPLTSIMDPKTGCSSPSRNPSLPAVMLSSYHSALQEASGVLNLIEPALRDGALLEDIATANAGDEFRLWWLGQSGFLLQWHRRHLLMDPYLSDSLTGKYADTPTPHLRMTAIPVKPELLNVINVVTSSHIHTDHLDPDTLHALFKVNPGLKFVIPEAERSAISKKLSVSWTATFGLSQGGSVELDGFRISAVASAHETVELDPAGRSRFLGYVIEFGGWTIYHSGDTVLHPTLVPSLRAFRIDVALLPINGRNPRRGVAGNLNAQEAASLAREVGARIVIPCHYEMFAFNTASVEDFVVAARAVRQSYHVLRCGERWESSRLGEMRDLPEVAHWP
jgi:L-ascorbate metabolism protein UlaG (beta-lactamase superfamily)